MSSIIDIRSVNWFKNYEITELDQPVAPILGILGRLRSNQWLVLFRDRFGGKTDYFPFRKRELQTRLSDADPMANAEIALQLPGEGVPHVRKRVWNVPLMDDGADDQGRMVLVDEAGRLIGIGAPSDRPRRISSESLTSSAKRVISAHISVVELPGTTITEAEAAQDGLFLPSPSSGPSPLSPPPPPPLVDFDPESIIVPVYYGTDRKRGPESTLVNARYMNARSQAGEVSLGICSVSIPNTHKLGKLERPPFWKFWSKPHRSQHVMLLSTVEIESPRFWAHLREAVATNTERNVFIFVHGYNVSFETAALRTAQLASDLDFQGGPIMFSWPSKAGILNYTADEESIQWSRPHLQTFIEDVCSEVGAESVHLIAHSMGSRAIVEVLQALNSSALPTRTLRQLIFAAPDVDAALFQQSASLFGSKCTRVTIYASDNDKALQLSTAFHGYPRAGQAGAQLLITSGVDTIDASTVDTDFLGHSSFAESRPIMHDIYSVIRHGHAPNSRFGLLERSNPDGVYWTFKP
jgi:esterase/lipase superfamily enzyme